MIKLTNYSNENELLEKLAGAGTAKLLTSIAKLLKSTSMSRMARGTAVAYRRYGGRKALEYASRYRNPLSYFPTSFKGGVLPHGLSKGKIHGMKRGTQRFLGNIAYSGHVLSKGGAQKGFRAPLQVARNLGNLAVQQLRAAKFKSVDLSMKPKGVFGQGVVTRKGKKFWKSYSPWSKRKIVGTVGKEGIVEKRLLTRPLTYATTGPGFGAMMYAGSDKSKSKAQRAAGSLGEAALWTAAPGVAGAYLLARLPKDIKDMVKPKKIENIKPY